MRLEVDVHCVGKGFLKVRFDFIDTFGLFGSKIVGIASPELAGFVRVAVAIE